MEITGLGHSIAQTRPFVMPFANAASVTVQSHNHATPRADCERCTAAEKSAPLGEEESPSTIVNISSQGLRAAAGDLDPQEQRLVEDLRKRDRQVRAHELAHLSAAGPYATGGPSFTYQVGPDGKRYAVGGEVPIDTSPVAGDPRATLQKANAIRRAAMAPANPSSTDRSVAAKAASMAAKAQQELIQVNNRQDAASPKNATSNTHTPGEDDTQQPNSTENPEASISDVSALIDIYA